MNWRRHARLLLALPVGIAAALAATALNPIDRILLGGDVFFAVYLLLAFRHAARLDVAELRRHGEEDDEGAALIRVLSIAAVMLSLGAVIATLGGLGPEPGRDDRLLRPVLAVASVPLGWATLHMVLAFHYAWAFYDRAEERGGVVRRGLDFPGDGDPGIWDFIYFSFTIGMTAQTSDVGIETTALRRLATLHGALSFFYNTVILALAVNVAVSLG